MPNYRDSWSRLGEVFGGPPDWRDPLTEFEPYEVFPREWMLLGSDAGAARRNRPDAVVSTPSAPAPGETGLWQGFVDRINGNAFRRNAEDHGGILRSEGLGDGEFSIYDALAGLEEPVINSLLSLPQLRALGPIIRAVRSTRSADDIANAVDELRQAGLPQEFAVPGSETAIPEQQGIAARARTAYDLPLETRPLEADFPRSKYPNGPPLDSFGRPSIDPEGNSIVASIAAFGRRLDNGATEQIEESTADEYIDGFTTYPQQALPREGRHLNGNDGSLLFADTGRQQAVPWIRDRPTARPYVAYADDLAEDSPRLFNVLVEELAHAIDLRAGRAPTVHQFNRRQWGISPGRLADDATQEEVELYAGFLRVYNQMKNPRLLAERRGDPIPPELLLLDRNSWAPGDDRYPKVDWDRELVANAISAYMINANWLKNHYPEVARAIRRAVNNNPRLRYYFQFTDASPAIGASSTVT